MAVRKAEVLFVGDAASIVRAAKQAELATAQAAAAAKKSAGETATANKVAGDSAVASAGKQTAAHRKSTASIADVGAAMGKMTAPILLAAGAGVKFSVDFQRSMEQIHTQAGATQGEVDKMSKAVLKLAPSTEQGPQKLAKALYLLESVGLRGKTAMQALGAASKGAAVGNANLTDTTDALAGVMVALHEKGGQAAKQMGAIDAVVGVGKMHMQDFVDSLKSGIIPTAHAVGLSFASVTAGLATLTDAGVPAEMAATKMRTILLMLAHEHTSAAVDGLKSVGLSADQVAQSLRRPDGLALTLELLKTHIEGLSKVKKVDLMTSLAGGSRSAGTLITLEQQIERVKNKYGQIQTLSGQFNSRVAAESQTSSHKIQTAWSAVQTTLIQVGGSLAPVVSTLAGDISKVAQAFSALPSGTQHAIITGGLIVAGIGPALKILGVFTSGIGKLWEVAQLISGAKVLGAVGGGGAASAMASTGASAASTGAASAGLMAGIKGLASRAVGGLAIGGLGVLISQTVGTAVHGGVGSAIKSIGTDASIGAGLGAMFGPAGMAGGAILGGLVGTFTHFSKSYGATIGGKLFAGGFGGALAGSLAKQTAAALDELHKLTTGAPQVRAAGRAGVTNVVNIRLSMDQLTGDALLKAEAAATRAGTLVAGSLEAGWSQYKFQSEPIMFSQLRSKLNGLPPAAQAAAAQSAIQFAATLEKKGTLARGATERMLASVERQFPAFSQYLGLTAGAGVKQFTAAMDLRKAEANTKRSLDAMRGDFPEVVRAMDTTAGDMETRAAAVVRALRSVQRDGTGPNLAKATQDIAAMRNSVKQDMTKMADVTVVKSQALAAAVKAGSSQASQSAQVNMQHFATHVQDAMSNGLVSVGRGMKLIIDTTNKALKEMGQKQLSQIQVAVMKGSAGLPSQPFAAGGLVQFGRAGDKGRDTIPVQMGGQNIAVGSGEVGAVFNHTQQKVANHLLSPVGGLPGLFNNVTRPHYMAQGGMVGNVPAMIAEANRVNSKHFPYVWGGGHSGFTGGPFDCSGAVSDILHAGGVLNAPRVSGDFMNYGAPGPGAVTLYANPTHVFMSLLGRFFGTSGANAGGGAGWFAGSARPGFAVRHVGAGGHGGAGGFGQIATPKITGSGTMATIARAALSKVAGAANKKLSAVSASVMGGAFGGGQGPEGHFSGSLAGWLTEALNLTHHFTPGNLNALEGRAMQESTGNPRSINLTDSNAKAGHPSKGLLQTIDSTFASYKLPGHNNIWNPVDNAAAAIRYMFARYGHIVGPGGGGYARGGMLPFAGAFKNGGVVPGPVGSPSMAMVHGGEVIHAAKGLLSKNPTSGPLSGISVASAQALYPLDAALAELTAKIAALTAQTAPNHGKLIASLTDQIAAIRREKLNPPKASNAATIAGLETSLQGIKRERINLPTPASGKAGDAQRIANAKTSKDLANQALTIEKQIASLKKGDKNTAAERRTVLENQVLTIENKIAGLKEKDKSAKTSLADTIKGLNLQTKNLTQLKSYTDAITTLKTQMKDLGAQAAQAWRTVQEAKINATHDAAIAAINNGATSQQLAAMQSQDKIDQNERQLDSLNKSLAAAQKQLATDQNLATHSGGQTHIDALAAVANDQAAVQDAQQQITDFMRQQDEQRLQDQITAATNGADATQATAVAGLDQQTADYQASLDNQLGALTDNLNARKITYAQWAKDVNAILAQYGLAAPTDATTEGTVVAGPGVSDGGGGGARRPTKPPARHRKSTGGLTGGQKHYRAGGGDVQPGYVYRVGEQGPEDVVFGRQGTVLTASQTRRGDMEGGPVVHIEHANFTGTQAARAFADRLAFRAAIGTA